VSFICASSSHGDGLVCDSFVLVPPMGIETSPIHLSMKEGSLFCFVAMRSTKPGCFRLCS
jgi:hypothetical protein